ncbi:UDP-N-acetylmuramate--L-alanine ligase [uncultured Nonlabens sp.]|uniref:UDP-N-acetylmuramate--L-alanine ligase n=1 Tax=uncultured Nonlabens sp. TaxID=859306 RepID=UPI00262A1852|nr:UDP-N-acetylmuramate--L-alanine ligase [uncultured Nonlabens sp.]
MKELEHITHFYFIGIGGIGMSALARYLNDQGKHVAGYDRVVTALSKKLEDEGIDIHYSDSFCKIPEPFKNIETSQVIYTPAVPEDFGELVRFRESGINILKRAQLLGQISKTMTCLAIAGTHGKTTTSAILAHLLYKSDVKVTAFLGGIMEEYDTNYLCSGTDVMVVEADEFDRSFMQLVPDIAGITSMDADHLDIYGDAATFKKSFHDFARLLDGKTLLLNEKLDLKGLKVGLDSGDYEAIDEVIIDGAYHFDLKTPHGKIDKCLLKLPGKHNLSNAILAMAVALEQGANPEKLRYALASFPGVKRRFTYRVDNDHRVLIDDYAHHPKEIDAVYQAVTEMYPDQEKLVVFQPHLFSRTRDFIEEFAISLSRFNKVALLDIYPARELPLDGITSELLCRKIHSLEQSPDVVTVVDKDDIEEFINDMGTRIVIMLGAGDIGVEVNKLTEKWSNA